jgi:hypothetical protein
LAPKDVTNASTREAGEAGTGRRTVRLVAGKPVRVLKPGGFLIIADIALHEVYIAELTVLGVQDLRLIPPGLLGRIASVASFGSFYPAAVTGTKGV